MLNNGWPSLIWHLYDFYLRPGGGYFGAKKALEELHPMYSLDDRSVWVVSSQYQDARGLKLTARIYNLDMTEKLSRQVSLDAAADSTNRVLDLPQIEGLSPVYFLDLRLEDSRSTMVGSNFYWLSTKPETLAWEKSTWFVTPTASYADFSALQRLPAVALRVSSHTERSGQNSMTDINLENRGNSLAFFIRLKVNRGAAGPEILPVLWQDNYFSLLPGEKRTVRATYRSSDLGGANAAVEVSGWNIQK
jgi:exo-1,4-beta-D-glucosaminidase